MRVIGVDHGSRRIGVAVGDTETGMAFAREALRHTRADRDVAAVEALARHEGADVVVLGLPLNMDGSEGPQAASAREFGRRLAAAGLTVELVDERLTSWQARQELAATGRQPSRRTGELDSVAARAILQEYLDARARPGRFPPGASQEAE